MTQSLDRINHPVSSLSTVSLDHLPLPPRGTNKEKLQQNPLIGYTFSFPTKIDPFIFRQAEILQSSPSSDNNSGCSIPSSFSPATGVNSDQPLTMVNSSPTAIIPATKIEKSSLSTVARVINIVTNLLDNVFKTPYKNFHARRQMLLHDIAVPGQIETQLPNDYLKGKGAVSSLL